MASTAVRVAMHRGIAVATIANPPVNSLGYAVRAGLLAALDRAAAEKADALVLIGDGATWPAGADIAEVRRA
jgi:3-hydroxyacyl-CoA dehydrogenase